MSKWIWPESRKNATHTPVRSRALCMSNLQKTYKRWVNKRKSTTSRTVFTIFLWSALLVFSACNMAVNLWSLPFWQLNRFVYHNLAERKRCVLIILSGICNSKWCIWAHDEIHCRTKNTLFGNETRNKDLNVIGLLIHCRSFFAITISDIVLFGSFMICANIVTTGHARVC